MNKRKILRRMMAKAKKTWMYVTSKYKDGNGRDTGEEENGTE